jgi:glycosyltransferase involved in cell wall biosynthesis
VVRTAAFAVPGDLATPTGGYVYDRRIIAELPALGWHIDVLDLGDRFPRPPADMRAAAGARLAGVPPGHPVVVDGLALGVLPEAAAALQASHALVALIHHPLALEAGLSAGEAACLRTSERAALVAVRHVITTSTATARILADDYCVPSGRLSVVEPGTDRVAPTPRRRDNVVTLLAVGSVVPRKGYDVLIAALGRIRHLSWRLVIAGDCGRSPDTLRNLEADIARLGLAGRVALLGAAPYELLTSLYAAADLFVLPSRFEGYGMAYAEAMAHGVPVIGTTAGAIPQTVPAGAGVLLPPDDVDALSATLQRLIENPEERERLAAGARATRFPSWPEQAARFAAVLERVA